MNPFRLDVIVAAATLSRKKHLPLCCRYKKHLLNEDKKRGVSFYASTSLQNKFDYDHSLFFQHVTQLAL